jgi:hypothetical protein
LNSKLNLNSERKIWHQFLFQPKGLNLGPGHHGPLSFYSVPAQRAPPGRRGPLQTSWPTGLRRPLGPLPCSSPTSVARAAIGLNGAAAPHAAVRLRPPPPHGTGRRLASSSFPLSQPAPPPLPLPCNRPLNSPSLNRTSADRSLPRQPPPLLPEPI